MKCDSCGMAITKRKPIREETGGQIRYYCCLDCFQEDLCRRDRPLRRTFGSRTQRTPRARDRRTADRARA